MNKHPCAINFYSSWKPIKESKGKVRFILCVSGVLRALKSVVSSCYAHATMLMLNSYHSIYMKG